MATASVDAIIEPNSAASYHFHPAACICITCTTTRQHTFFGWMVENLSEATSHLLLWMLLCAVTFVLRLVAPTPALLLSRCRNS